MSRMRTRVSFRGWRASSLQVALLGAAALLATACGGSAATGEEPKTPESSGKSDGASEVLEEPGSREEDAILDILSGNPTEIRVDGKKVGTTPINGHKVSPGTHDVTFVFSEEDAPTLSVTVGPGDSKTVKLDPPPGIKESGKGGAEKGEKTEKK